MIVHLVVNPSSQPLTGMDVNVNKEDAKINGAFFIGLLNLALISSLVFASKALRAELASNVIVQEA